MHEASHLFFCQTRLLHYVLVLFSFRFLFFFPPLPHRFTPRLFMYYYILVSLFSNKHADAVAFQAHVQNFVYQWFQ